MNTKIPVSVIIPAYNEEGNIADAISGVEQQLKCFAGDYEMIVVNDGSHDRTSQVVKTMLKKLSGLRFIDRQQNRGLTYTFMEGVRLAKMEYVTAFHGDNDASSMLIADLIRSVDQADIINIYPTNTRNRNFTRRTLSALFIRLMNLLFRLNIRYYNGTFLCKTEILKDLQLVSRGFTVYAEAKIRLANQGYSIKEIPFKQTRRKTGHSTALSLASFLDTIRVIIRLFLELYFLN